MNTKKKAPKEKFSAAVRISMRPAERELVDRAVELSGGRGELSDFGRTAILEKAREVVDRWTTVVVERMDTEGLRGVVGSRGDLS